MSDQRVAEYQEYYRARLRRYDGNPLYPATAQAERAMCAAVEASTSVEDMQQRILGAGLHLECGRALLRDQANARAALYAETHEPIRAQGPAAVLAGVDAATDAAALASLASDAYLQADRAVTADECNRMWTSALTALENAEVWRTAVVPEQWRRELDGYAAEAVGMARDAWRETVTGVQQTSPGWQFDEQAARAERHRRIVPLSDTTFEQRVAEHRTVVRGCALMAVDAAMVDAMLGSFRDLLAGVRAQGAAGADVDEMAATLAEMEALAQQLSDVGQYSTRLANDGYYQRFTDAYTRVMLAASGGSGSGAIPDDAALLTQALQAYENALTQLRGVPDQDVAIAALERIVEIGRSDVTYPQFLTQLEDEALNDVLAGSVTPTRAQLVASLDLVRSLVDPAREAEAAALVAARDELAAASPTGAVDPFAFSLRQFRIGWEHAPAIARRDALVPRLARLVDLVIDWLDAHTTWASWDKRFVGATPADTAKRIAMARACNPGFYAVRARQFADAFGPQPWWMRPEFAEERRARRILWTDARLELAIDAVAACKPLAVAPAELVARAEAFGPDSF